MVEHALENPSGTWGTTGLASARTFVEVCTCGGMHSMVLHELEFRSEACCHYGGVVNRVPADVPVTWLSTFSTQWLVDPIIAN